MLIHIRHAQNRELVPDSLVFEFEESSLRHRLGEMGRRVSGRHSGKEEEAPVFIPVAKREQVFAGLPLSCGHRFCLQIPDARRSELHLVISPLSSLNRNPKIPLKINAPIRDASLHIHYNSLTLGRIHLLYVTPESLISRSLREDLYAVVNKAKVSTLLIDKAYCISEWGPDFRPAYLRIPQIIKDLQMQNPDLTVIALSGICTDMIRQDVVRVLKLKDISPHSRRDFYREKISFQAVMANSPEEKIRAYEELVKKNFPSQPGDKEISNPSSEMFLPYCDPYALFWENISAHSHDAEIPSQSFPDVAVRTHRKGKQENRHIRIDTALGDSPEAWMVRTAAATGEGGYFHSVRVTDLPCTSCETDMRTRKTRIPLCAGTQCLFDRKTVCDYGSHHRVVRYLYPDGAAEIMTALHLLDFLVTSHKAGENPQRIPLSAFRQRNAERALFRLAVIRLIDRFSIDCRDQEPVFKIYGYTGTLTAEVAHAGILTYLRRNDISATRRFDFHTLDQMQEKTGEIDRYWEMCKPSVTQAVSLHNNDGANSLEGSGEGDKKRLISNGFHPPTAPPSREGRPSSTNLPHCLRNYGEHQDLFLTVARYLAPVVCHIQENLRNMAYRRLWHLKERIKARGCLYSALLKNVQTADEDWKCGRCDRCVPEPGSAPASLSRPPESYRLAELEERFSRWMENREIPFDAVSADRFIQDFGDFYDNLRIRCHKILEHNPRNIKALYVVRELSPEEEKPMCTADLMQVAVLDMKPLQVIRFYETSQADTKLKQSMFHLMDNEYGTLNTPEGEQWLYRESLQLNQCSRISEMLGLRVLLNTLSKTDLSSLNTRLNQLLKEF